MSGVDRKETRMPLQR